MKKFFKHPDEFKEVHITVCGVFDKAESGQTYYFQVKVDDGKGEVITVTEDPNVNLGAADRGYHGAVSRAKADISSGEVKENTAIFKVKKQSRMVINVSTNQESFHKSKTIESWFKREDSKPFELDEGVLYELPPGSHFIPLMRPSDELLLHLKIEIPRMKEVSTQPEHKSTSVEGKDLPEGISLDDRRSPDSECL
jgi:hypothetical protein